MAKSTSRVNYQLSRYFELSDDWWLALRARDDIEVARLKMGRELAKILPRTASASQDSVS